MYLPCLSIHRYLTHGMSVWFTLCYWIYGENEDVIKEFMNVFDSSSDIWRNVNIKPVFFWTLCSFNVIINRFQPRYRTNNLIGFERVCFNCCPSRDCRHFSWWEVRFCKNELVSHHVIGRRAKCTYFAVYNSQWNISASDQKYHSKIDG
jgi:hypothetical protein